MREQRHQSQAARRLISALLGMVVMAALAGCSLSGGSASSTGGINFSQGLAGSTVDHPAQAPAIAANGPAGTYAFVYDSQIWVRQSGQTAAQQVTHLVLSNGGRIVWGPLVWSPDGNYIAFVLIQDLSPATGAPLDSGGPLYYVHVTDAAHTVYEVGTGSIYGHTYTWFGNNDLIYSNGGGLQFYDVSSGDPRVYPLRLVNSTPDNINGPTDYLTYGDVTFAGSYLYYTKVDVRSPGRMGAVGDAQLNRTYLGSPDNLGPGQVPQSGAPSEVMALGPVYSNPDGDYVTGAWALRGSTLVAQRVRSVDTQAGKVTSSIQALHVYSYYNSGTTSILGNAQTQPITAHPGVALASDGTAAYTGDALYVQGQDAKGVLTNWIFAPAWSPDGVIAATQLASQSTDAGGVVHITTNIAIYHPGQATGSVLIAGGQDIAWKP